MLLMLATIKLPRTKIVMFASLRDKVVRKNREYEKLQSSLDWCKYDKANNGFRSPYKGSSKY